MDLFTTRENKNGYKWRFRFFEQGFHLVNTLIHILQNRFDI